MNIFIEKVREFKLQRTKYFELYEKKKQQFNTKKKEKNDLVFDSYFQNQPMNVDELQEYGQMLSMEYSSFSPEKNKKYYSDDGVHTRLFDRVKKINFDLDISQYQQYGEYFSRKTSDTNEEIVWEERSQIDKNFLGKNASENFQKVYYLCLEKIVSLGIEIYGIKKDISQYKNSMTTCLGGGTTPFIFHCKKNNYKFEISYDDDCDCNPGILYVRSIIDCNSNETIIVNCDLFCQNTSNHIFKNFIMLLSCKNFDEFIEKRYGYITEMIELLKKNYDVNCSENFFTKNTMSINRFNYNAIVELTNSNKDKCLLIPHVDDNMKDYLMYLCPTLDDINNKKILEKEHYYYERKNIDINVFNMDLYPRFSFIYRSSDDMPELIKCIDCYMQYKKGNYGYRENNFYYIEDYYYNEKFIYDRLVGNNEYYDSFILYSRSNNYCGPDMDVVFFYETSDPFTACTRNHLENTIYPLDKYQVRLVYDKKTDLENCILTIQGKWHDVTVIAKKYYELVNQCDEKNKYDFDMNLIDYQPMEIAEKFEFKGKFSECFNKIAQFHFELTGKNPNDNSDESSHRLNNN